ncbi:MAG: ATP-binding protein [Gemmatimonadota bacterium]|nr:ATP-binding protein [Gemmatimonadota bacterium]
MWLDRLWDRRSLRARLLSRYLVILGIGGLVTSLIGSWIVSSTIMAQMHRALAHNLGTVRTIYEQRLLGLELVVRLTAFGPSVEHYLAAGDTSALVDHLDRIRCDNGFDFLTVTDPRGVVIGRTTERRHAGDDVSSLNLVAAALSGRSAAATEILTHEQLARENPELRARAQLPVSASPSGGSSPEPSAVTSGLVMMAAAPVRSADRPVSGALYGGILLNRNYEMVDGVWNVLYGGERYQDKHVGAVGIFQHDVCISTSVKNARGERAVGRRASQAVRGSAAGEGAAWDRRGVADEQGYVSAYEPLRNYAGDVVGALRVGVLQRLYTATRDRVILSFFAIATAGFLLIIIVTDFMVRQITRPIGAMVAATHNLAAGRFDQDVRIDGRGEIALLARSFNQMSESLRQMQEAQEEWGRTLEEKVQQRSEQLIAMQNRVAQSEKLASLGMLAAGVAHEINNPLGGVLSLTSLALEDLPIEHPARQNLEEVVRQSDRCREIVKGLLEFSRQQEAGSDRVDVLQMIDETLALMSKQALFFNVKLKKNYDATVPMVLADRSQLQQVFMNIVMNAVQAMGERGLLTVEVVATKDALVEIQVSDTGCGIPPGDIDRVFDPFYTTKKDGAGTGLGLSIAYGIITKHRGTISVASEVGKGTVVTIRLPASPEFAEERRA